MSITQTAPRTDAAVRLRQLQSLPPLPVVAQRLLKDLERDDLSIAQLASVIEMDPGLTARLMGLANSAYFAGGRPVSSLTDAVGRVLGLDLVKNLALGIILSGPFDTRRCHGFRAEQFWFQAMGASSLSGPLSNLLVRPPERDWLYLGGLLHELGLLALCSLCPVEMSLVFREASNPGEFETGSIPERARTSLGMTPAGAGAVLARRWRLPEPLAVVMSRSDDPEYRGPHWQINALVGLASALSRDLYHERPDSGDGVAWIRALCLSGADVATVQERHRSRAESLRALSRHMAMG